ncbi:MAG: ABC-three component system middle component 6 [Desulfosalsimonadaceae bacterium]
MILPSKHLSQERALLTVGGRILQQLRQPMTVSALWEELTRPVENSPQPISSLSYDEFVLALDILYLINTIEMEDGLLARRKS